MNAKDVIQGLVVFRILKYDFPGFTIIFPPLYVVAFVFWEVSKGERRMRQSIFYDFLRFAN